MQTKKRSRILMNLIFAEFQKVVLEKQEGILNELADVKRLLNRVLSTTDSSTVPTVGLSPLPLKSKEELEKLEAELQVPSSFCALVLN
jgi:hypothetical protein